LELERKLLGFHQLVVVLPGPSSLNHSWDLLGVNPEILDLSICSGMLELLLFFRDALQNLSIVFDIING
jgi:hypothetical protein